MAAFLLTSILYCSYLPSVSSVDLVINFLKDCLTLRHCKSVFMHWGEKEWMFMFSCNYMKVCIYVHMAFVGGP